MATRQKSPRSEDRSRPKRLPFELRSGVPAVSSSVWLSMNSRGPPPEATTAIVPATTTTAEDAGEHAAQQPPAPLGELDQRVPPGCERSDHGRDGAGDGDRRGGRAQRVERCRGVAALGLEDVEQPRQRGQHRQHRQSEPAEDAKPLGMGCDEHGDAGREGEDRGPALREHRQLDRERRRAHQEPAKPPVQPVARRRQDDHREHRHQEEAGHGVAVADGIAKRGVDLEQLGGVVADGERDQGGDADERPGHRQRREREQHPWPEQRAEPEAEHERDRVGEHPLGVLDRDVGSG